MTKEIIVPELGESIVEATVGEWRVKVGDTVKTGDVVVELETDKVDVEVGATATGTVVDIRQSAGSDVRIGDVLGVIDPNGVASTESESPPKPEAEETAVRPPAQPSRQADTTKPPAAEKVTPVARRLAEAEGLDLAGVVGSGAGGRVTKQDIAAQVESRSEPQPTPEPAPESAPLPPPPAQAPPVGREERVRMSRRRRTIAQRLVEAQHTAAMLTTFNEVDMGAVMELRKRRQEEFVKRYKIKLGFTSFFVKASIGALKAFPRINAELLEDEIVLKHYYDIGIAVGAEEGLVVPVIREADRKTFAEIEAEVADFAARSKANTLTLDDLRGGTFTITNGGVFGSMLSTPILNPPQVGILGLHNIQERPVVRDGQIVIRPIMYVALTYDHRIVDGREAVQFLVRVKQLIEDPEALLLEA